MTTVLAFAGGVLAQQKEPVVAYASTTGVTQPLFQASSGSGWYSGGAMPALSHDVIWQELVNSPVSGRALVSICENHSLWLTMWSPTTYWGTPVCLTTNAGLHDAKVFAAGYECESGELLAVYRKGTSTTLYYRVVGAAVGAEQSFTAGLTAAPTWLELYSQPRGHEMVLLAAAGGRLYAAVWNGAAWGNTILLESALPAAGRPFAGAYANGSGRAVVVWSDTSGVVRQRVWNGTAGAWGAAGTLPAVSGSAPLNWVSLAGSRRHASEEVLFAGIGTNNDISVNHWNGTAWGSNLVVETNTGAADGRRVALAYQADGAEAILAWEQAGSHGVHYRRWASGMWSGAGVTASLGSTPQAIRLEPGFANNQMVLSVRRKGAASYADFMAYSSGGSVNLTGTVSGPVGSGGAADLPVPPAATAGATGISTPNNSTVAMTPGNYAALEVGNACTLNFTAGDYVFTSFTAHYNNAVFNFDTSGGPIRFILTSGDFSGKNGITLNTLGPHQVEFHVLNGSFEAKNHYAVSNAAVFAYNGSIEFENNANFTGTLYASGNISGSGVIRLPESEPPGGPGRLTVVTFTGGTPGTPTDLCLTVPGEWRWGTCTLSAYPPPRSVKVGRWREIGPDE